MDGSMALARGELQHHVSVTGRDELAHLGQVFNDTARRLHDIFAALQSRVESVQAPGCVVEYLPWVSELVCGCVFENLRVPDFLTSVTRQAMKTGPGATST